MFQELLWRIAIGNIARQELLEREALEQDQLDEQELMQMGQEHGRLVIELDRLSLVVKSSIGRC